jgi:hypothetical protein
MKQRILIPTAIVTLSASLWWAFAQQAPAPLASLFPAGAMLYLEAKDANALLKDWDSSAEKTSWLASSNYEGFSRSHLYLRLADAQTEFAQAAGVPADYALFNSVAGANSAIAMYNIGSLEFLYITRLPSARALNTTLWRSRGSYQTRRAGGVDYYIKEDSASHRTAVFAYAGDLLLFGTRQDALAGALELIARVNRLSIASEPWYQSATQAAAPGDRALRLVYNMDRLAQTHQFRTHWIQNNTAALKEFASGLADLERTSGQMQERRVLLRTNASANTTQEETRAGQLLALAPDDAGLYRLWSHPDSTQASHWIEEKIFSATAAAPIKRDDAPQAAESGDAGSEADLEIRIDEPALTDSRSAQAFQTLRAQLNSANLDAMLEVSSTAIQPDQVFVQSHAALVLLSSSNWDANQIRTALTSAANGLWTAAGSGAGWRTGANGTQELDGLGKIVLAVDGQRLIVSDSADLVNSILARRARPAVPGASYEASWRHARELPNFDRMMRLIDFPQVHVPDPAAPANAPVDNSALFYSQNMASLGRVFGRVDSATITVHDLGAMLRENVVYRLRP